MHRCKLSFPFLGVWCFTAAPRETTPCMHATLRGEQEHLDFSGVVVFARSYYYGLSLCSPNSRHKKKRLKRIATLKLGSSKSKRQSPFGSSMIMYLRRKYVHL